MDGVELVTDAIEDRRSMVVTEFAFGLRGERGGRGGDAGEGEEGEVPGPVWLLLSECDGTPATRRERGRSVVFWSRLPVVVVDSAITVRYGCPMDDMFRREQRGILFCVVQYIWGCFPPSFH